MASRRPSATVTLKAMTWSRDSHGLFDYESRHVTKSNVRTSSTGSIVRVANEVAVLPDNAPEDDKTKLLARLQQKDGVYFIGQGDRMTASSGATPEKLWLVVRSLRAQNGIKGYVLQEGDIVKLGRVKLRVKELVVGAVTPAAADAPVSASTPSGAVNSDVSGIPADMASAMADDDEMEILDGDGEPGSSPTPMEVQPTSEPAPVFDDPNGAACCRICLCDNAEPGNPLISPCKCKGTMKNVHLQCLRSWVEGRLNLNTQNGQQNFTFFWRTLDCELCKVPYPTVLEIEGRVQELFEIPKPQTPYIVLEALSRDRNNTNRGLHVISFANKPVVKLGRGHDSDVRVSDISVSRCHAMIRFFRDQFYLEDNTSKFGTLVQVKRPIKIEANQNTALQIGRTVIAFGLRRPWNFLPACLRPSSAGNAADAVDPVTGHPLPLMEPMDGDRDDGNASPGDFFS